MQAQHSTGGCQIYQLQIKGTALRDINNSVRDVNVTINISQINMPVAHPPGILLGSSKTFPAFIVPDNFRGRVMARNSSNESIEDTSLIAFLKHIMTALSHSLTGICSMCKPQSSLSIEHIPVGVLQKRDLWSVSYTSWLGVLKKLVPQNVLVFWMKPCSLPCPC